MPISCISRLTSIQSGKVKTVITALAVKKRKPLHHADCDIETKLRFLLADIPVDNVPQTRSPE